MGNQDAIRACIERYGALVWGIARRFFGASADAEDAVQDAFLDLWRSAGRYDRAVSSEPVFVAMIARRRFSEGRGRARRPLAPEPLGLGPETGAPSVAEQSADAQRASRALDQLRPE